MLLSKGVSLTLWGAAAIAAVAAGVAIAVRFAPHGVYLQVPAGAEAPAPMTAPPSLAAAPVRHLDAADDAGNGRPSPIIAP